MRCADYPAGRIAGLDQSGGWHASPSVSRLNLDGGSEKWGHYGREKGASDVVTQWPAVDTPVPDGEPAPFSGGKVFRGFGLLGAIGFAFDLQYDRSFDQTIEEGHRQRTVGEIFSPFIEVPSQTLAPRPRRRGRPSRGRYSAGARATKVTAYAAVCTKASTPRDASSA